VAGFGTLSIAMMNHMFGKVVRHIYPYFDYTCTDVTSVTGVAVLPNAGRRLIEQASNYILGDCDIGGRILRD